jgi:hypothetical protein
VLRCRSRIAQGDKLTAIRQRDRIIEDAVPAAVRYQSLIRFSTTKSSGSSGSVVWERGLPIDRRPSIFVSTFEAKNGLADSMQVSEV